MEKQQNLKKKKKNPKNKKKDLEENKAVNINTKTSYEGRDELSKRAMRGSGWVHLLCRSAVRDTLVEGSPSKPGGNHHQEDSPCTSEMFKHLYKQ